MTVYLLVLAVVTVVVVLVRRRFTAPRSTHGVPVLDPFATAYLAGRSRRVALLAISNMVDSGELILEGRLLRRRDMVDDAAIDPIRAAVLRGFGTEQRAPGNRLLEQARRQPELKLWEQPLRAQGLLGTQRRRIGAALIPLPLTAASIAYWPLAFGPLSGQGAGFFALSPIAVLITVLSIGMIISTPRQTPLGREVLYRAERAHRRGRPDPVLVDGRHYPASAFVFAAKGDIATRNRALSTALGAGD